MRFSLSTLTFALIFSTSLTAQDIVFQDNFENNSLSSSWNTWSNNSFEKPSLAFDKDNLKSLHITGNGNQDVVLGIGEQLEKGIYQLSFSIKTDANKGGYFGLVKKSSFNYNHALEVFINKTGATTINIGDVEKNLTIKTNEWIPVLININLYSGIADVEIAGQKVNNLNWSINSIGSLNFFAYAPENDAVGYMVDNVLIKKTSRSTLANNAKLNVFPNPATDIVNFKLENLPQGNFNIQLMNANGTLVTNQSIDANKATGSFDVSKLAKGIYIIELSGNREKMSKRFVVQ